MTFTIKECSENSIVLRPRLELYQVRDYMGQCLPGLAIVLDKVDGEEIDQFAVLTVSFGDFISAENCAYVDLNNCTFAPILLEHGVARDTGLKKNKRLLCVSTMAIRRSFPAGNRERELSEVCRCLYQLYEWHAGW